MRVGKCYEVGCITEQWKCANQLDYNKLKRSNVMRCYVVSTEHASAADGPP